MATPYFYINPPFSRLSRFSTKILGTPPQETEFFEGPIPHAHPLGLRGRGGGSNYVFKSQSSSTVKKMAAINVISLNKTDVENFPWKFLLTPRRIRAFKNAWLHLVALLLNFSWSRYKVNMMGKTVNTSRIFCIEFREWLCSHFCHRVIDW